MRAPWGWASISGKEETVSDSDRKPDSESVRKAFNPGGSRQRLASLLGLASLASEPKPRHRHTTFGPREVKTSGDPHMPGEERAKRKARRKQARKSRRINRQRRG